ncbi:hyalin-like, partial [Anneissia japonica]|uniref:hyalin-like n=1 Tax=Anneissia japonica TaxID=1529436 RepID=UPI00142585A8
MDNQYIMNFTSNYRSGDAFVIGVIEVNYIAIDPSGNIAICTFNVNITDHEYPVLHCPDEIMYSTDTNLYYSTVYWNVSVTDNSGFATLNCTSKSGDQFNAIWPVAQQPVTCLALDPYNNVESCIFNITVY